ncbi:hypothetical protein ACS0TY_010837 [Phlomoides rotata]
MGYSDHTDTHAHVDDVSDKTTQDMVDDVLHAHSGAMQGDKVLDLPPIPTKNAFDALDVGSLTLTEDATNIDDIHTIEDHAVQHSSISHIREASRVSPDTSHDLRPTCGRGKDSSNYPSLKVREASVPTSASINEYMKSAAATVLPRISSDHHPILLRIRKTSVGLSSLVVDGELTFDPGIISDSVIQFYTELFTAQDQATYDDSVLGAFIHPVVEAAENAALLALPCMEEIRRAVFDMEPSSSTGPDGFIGSFYPSCWDIISFDVIAAGILSAYGRLSGQVYFGMAVTRRVCRFMLRTTGISHGSLPFYYLGVPIIGVPPELVTWRLLLTPLSANSANGKKIEDAMRKFLWKGDISQRNNSCSVSWARVCSPLDKGGWVFARFDWPTTLLSASSHGTSFTTGIFSASMFLEVLTVGFGEILSRIWGLSIPPCRSTLIGRAIWGKLPTADWLRQFGIQGPMVCFLCHSDSESLDHIFAHCSFTRSLFCRVTAFFDLTLYCDIGFLDVFLQAIRFQFSKQLGHLWRAAFISTIWSIWHARNRAVFDDIQPTIQHCMTFIVASIEETDQVPLGNFSGSVRKLLILGRLGLSGRLSPTTIIRWRPPQAGWYKVNVDGSAHISPGPLFAGAIFRNSRGFFVVAFSKSVGWGFPLEAELASILHAILFAFDYGWHSLWVESNSILAIHTLQKRIQIVP